MGAQPIHILSPRVDPAGALAFLRTLSPKVQVEGPDSRWKRATIKDRGGLMFWTAKQTAFRHVPDYYEQPDFPQQTAQLVEVMLNVKSFDELPAAVKSTIMKGRFWLSVEAEPDLDLNDVLDDRRRYVFGLARHLDGVLVTSTGIRDADGKTLVAAGPEQEDPPPNPPTAQRVASRTVALAAVAGRGLLEAADAPRDDALRQRLIQWIETVGVREELEPDEEKILQQPVGVPSQQEIVNATWRLEGLAVLAWSLGRFELPEHDQMIDPGVLMPAVGFLDAAGAKGLLADPHLRAQDEINATAQKILTIHWRLREYRLTPKPINFPKVAKDAWFPLNLAGVRLIDSDLALGEFAIAKAPPELYHTAASIAQERHQAINWLCGDNDVYSETDTST